MLSMNLISYLSARRITWISCLAAFGAILYYVLLDEHWITYYANVLMGNLFQFICILEFVFYTGFQCPVLLFCCPLNNIPSSAYLVCHWEKKSPLLKCLTFSIYSLGKLTSLLLICLIGKMLPAFAMHCAKWYCHSYWSDAASNTV